MCGADIAKDIPILTVALTGVWSPSFILNLRSKVRERSTIRSLAGSGKYPALSITPELTQSSQIQKKQAVQRVYAALRASLRECRRIATWAVIFTPNEALFEMSAG